MNNVLLYIGGLLVVVLAALFGLPYAVDWNGYRGVFEEEASRILGRDVRVSGNVGLRLLPSPYVHMEKLRVGGAVGEEAGRPLFRADDFTMWLSVPPLLKGIVEARDIELRKPVVELTMDAEGRTSLSTLQITPGTLSFVPQEVSLQAVRIIDGTIGLSASNGMQLLRADGITGELSADALDGPFRFKGTLRWEGEDRELRLTTGQQDANGDLRLKAVTTVLKNGNSYVLDGTARGLDAAPTFSGTLAARISSRALIVDEAGGAAPADAAPAPQPLAHFDVTAKVASEPGRINLDDIAISMEQGGLPQLISGKSSVHWADRVSLDVDLSSKWLDLDLLTGTKGEGNKAIPLELARALFDRLVDELPETADTNLALALDQIGLGGQSVSGLTFVASRAGGALELKELRAGLPGGTNLALDGVLEGDAGARAFTGTMSLSGQSLSRFSTWGFGENPFSRTRSDGPFAVEGSLLLSDAAIELTEASAEINGTPLLGEIRLGLIAPRRLAVALDGQKINLSELWPDNPGLSGIRRLLMSGTVGPLAATQADEPQTANNDGSAETDGQPAAAGFGAADVSLDIKAGELIDGAQRLSNVHLDIALQKGRLSVPRLKFEAAGGLAVDLEGSAVDVPAKTRGELRGIVEAPSPEAATTLTQLLDLPPDVASEVAPWTRLAPWRLATTVSIGERRDEAVDVSLDGVLRGGRLVATARIDAARGNWRNAPADFTASVETADIDGFLDMLAQMRGTVTEAGSATRAGTIFVKAAGKAAEGLVSVVEIDAPAVTLDFNGRVVVPEDKAVTAKGDVRIDAQDLRRVLALAGLPVAPGAQNIAMKGSLAVAHDGARLTLASPALKISNSMVSGVVAYTPGTDNGAAMVDAEISADQASLPGLLSAITAADAREPVQQIELPGDAPPATKRKSAAALAETETPPEPASIWPEQAFDLSPLDRINGTVKASMRSLTLQPGVAMKDARLELALTPGRLDVRGLEGAVLGGKAISVFGIEKLAAGASLTGDFKIAVSSKGSAESGVDDALDGDVAALSVSYSGRALSPNAMIGALTGKGQLVLGDVTLNGVSPSAVSAVSEAALLGKGPVSGAPLTEALTSELKSSALKLGKVDVPVEISDGTMKLARVQVETPDGRATFDTLLDLQTLKLDSSWKIEGKSAVRAAPSVAGAEAGDGAPAPVAVERRLLPPVSVVYAGPLANLSSMQPALVTDALERELAVRRMERDVDELERLRALDQLRAQQERERRQALEAERRRKAEEAERARQLELAPPNGAEDGNALPGDTLPGASNEIDQNPLPPGADGAPAGGPEAGETGNLLPAPETAVDATAVPPAARQVQRSTAPVRKKPVKPAWQPFQITPYQ